MTPAPAHPMPPPFDPRAAEVVVIRRILNDPARRLAHLRARARRLVVEAEKEAVQ